MTFVTNVKSADMLHLQVWIKILNMNVYEMFYCLALLHIQEVLLGSYYSSRLPILTGFHVFSQLFQANTRTRPQFRP